MTRIQKIGVVGVCVVLAAGSLLPPFLRAQGTPAVAAASGRTPEKIMDDLRATQADAVKVMPSLIALGDADFRAGEGQKAIPSLKKMVVLWGELQNAVPDKEEKEAVRINKFRFMSFAGALGDKETLATLNETAKGKDADALSAKAALALDGWLTSSKDSAAQIKVLDEFAPVVKENAKSDEVLSILEVMANLGSASNDSTKKVIDVIRTNMDTELAKDTLSQLDGMQEQMAMVGKPFAVAGRTSTGGKFDSSQYQGKVVMLDFWATWCGPCIEELPNVKQAYKDYHEKGFEIVGISCDTNDSDLNTFTKEKEMPWVQLRETSQDEKERWHPLAKKFHVDGIPAMFLIDRKGVLRYVDARQDLEKKIAALVAEPAPAPAAAKP